MRKSLHRPENLVLIQLLRDLRQNLNLRQAELAERLKVSQNFISNVEQGIRRLDVVELRDYAKALDSNFAQVTAAWESRLQEAPSTSPRPAKRSGDRKGKPKARSTR